MLFFYTLLGISSSFFEQIRGSSYFSYKFDQYGESPNLISEQFLRPQTDPSPRGVGRGRGLLRWLTQHRLAGGRHEARGVGSDGQSNRLIIRPYISNNTNQIHTEMFWIGISSNLQLNKTDPFCLFSSIPLFILCIFLCWFPFSLSLFILIKFFILYFIYFPFNLC